jgi:uncharacterized membrane protein
MPRLGFPLLVLLSIVVAAYALVVYSTLPLGRLLHPDMQRAFVEHAWVIRIHIFASAVALALGPLQFSTRLRARWPQVHRWMGRIYLGVGVLIGGLAGLIFAPHAYGGLPGKLGFAFLAAAWLYTGARAFAAIRSGDVAAHRRWMVRNFALTFAAVTLRLYLPSSMLLRIPFDIAYPVIAWACWVPNVWVAERLLRAKA